MRQSQSQGQNPNLSLIQLQARNLNRAQGRILRLGKFVSGMMGLKVELCDLGVGVEILHSWVFS